MSSSPPIRAFISTPKRSLRPPPSRLPGRSRRRREVGPTHSPRLSRSNGLARDVGLETIGARGSSHVGAPERQHRTRQFGRRDPERTASRRLRSRDGRPRHRAFGNRDRPRLAGIRDPWPDLTSLRPDQPFALWSGRLQSRLVTRWWTGHPRFNSRSGHPRRVLYRFASQSPGVAGMVSFPAEEREVRLPALSQVPMPRSRRMWRRSFPGVPYTVHTSAGLPRTALGNPSDVNAVTIGLINFTHEELDSQVALNGEQETRAFGELNVDPWHLTLWGRHAASAHEKWWEPLARSGSYAFTPPWRFGAATAQALMPPRSIRFEMLSSTCSRLRKADSSDLRYRSLTTTRATRFGFVGRPQSLIHGLSC